jgi:hypothetical protein
VTRNECLPQFPAIRRLGARIKDLEKEGYYHDGTTILDVYIVDGLADGSLEANVAASGHSRWR